MQAKPKNSEKKPYLKVIDNEPEITLYPDVTPLEVLSQFEESDMAENDIIANIEPF